jgi:hypothetical protein
MAYVYDIDVDTIYCSFVCAYVALHEREVELWRAPTHQEPERPPRGGSWVGERCQHEDTRARPTNPEGAARRHLFDDPGIDPSHTPPVDAREDFEDIRHCLEVVLHGVP